MYGEETKAKKKREEKWNYGDQREEGEWKEGAWKEEAEETENQFAILSVTLTAMPYSFRAATHRRLECALYGFFESIFFGYKGGY
jgi:hypothetical protein